MVGKSREWFILPSFSIPKCLICHHRSRFHSAGACFCDFALKALSRRKLLTFWNRWWKKDSLSPGIGGRVSQPWLWSKVPELGAGRCHPQSKAKQTEAKESAGHTLYKLKFLVGAQGFPKQSLQLSTSCVLCFLTQWAPLTHDRRGRNVSMKSVPSLSPSWVSGVNL